MSSRRGQSLPPPHMAEKPTRGRCVRAICFSWKVITCIVSHVTLVLLVVGYCVGGAYLFQHLERPHEIEVKLGIQNMRRNLSNKIWKFSDNVSVLSENDWIASVKLDLANFEKQILTAMKTDGWDGNEDATKSQWTFAGSLFYSIIVITTIGYGHISPRTDWGKVTTIFYAIVGIPLMLLCLSNIGDVMATSFRFIYWRVCCYICTRNEKRSRQRSRQRSMRRYASRSQPPPPSFRRSMKLTQRSANDSGIGPSMGLPHAYSDPDLRTLGRGGDHYDEPHEFRGGPTARRHNQLGGSAHQRGSGGGSRHFASSAHYENERGYGGADDDDAQTLNRHGRYSSRQRNRDRMRDRHTVERERYIGRSKQQFGSMEELNALPASAAKRTLSVRSVRSPNPTQLRRDVEPARESRENNRELNRFNTRGRSVPDTAGRSRAKSADPRSVAPPYEPVDEEVVRKTPIIPNRYAIDDLEQRPQARGRGGVTSRSQSMPRAHHNRGGSHHQHGGPSGEQNERQGRGFSRQQSAPQARYGNRLELPDAAQQQSGGGHRRRGHTPRRDADDYDEEFEDYYFNERDVEGGGDYDDEYAAQQQRQQARYREPRKRRSERSERLPPSPRIMSPMGFAVKRQPQRRRPSYDYDDDSMYGDDWNDYSDLSPKDRPVPIWLCVFLVISYILGGAALFAFWESWSFLDSAYFCFITLTTIGFGDFVPAKGVKDESEQSIAYCSLYLLFGIALLAMSFNLVQEEFIANVKEVAKRLGILKDDDDDDD